MVENIIDVSNKYRNAPSKHTEIYRDAPKVSAANDTEIVKSRIVCKLTNRLKHQILQRSEPFGSYRSIIHN